MKTRLKTVLTLFLTFLKIGAFTFGGGYAMIPFIEKEIVEKHKWLTSEDILDIIAISESTPGPIAINSATFVGYKIGGFFGAFACTFGVVLPSFLIISLISVVLAKFSGNTYVQYAFRGIRAGVLALVIKALVSMYKKCPKSLFSYIVMGAAFVLSAVVSQFFEINTLFILIGCAVAGLVYSLLAKRRVNKA